MHQGETRSRSCCRPTPSTRSWSSSSHTAVREGRQLCLHAGTGFGGCTEMPCAQAVTAALAVSPAWDAWALPPQPHTCAPTLSPSHRGEEKHCAVTRLIPGQNGQREQCRVCNKRFRLIVVLLSPPLAGYKCSTCRWHLNTYFHVAVYSAVRNHAGVEQGGSDSQVGSSSAWSLSGVSCMTVLESCAFPIPQYYSFNPKSTAIE